MSPTPQRIVVCGGGNGAHVLVAEHGADPRLDVRILTRRPEAWAEGVECEEHAAINESFPLWFGRRAKRHQGRAEPFRWDRAEEALEGADVVVLVCPVHAHRPLLEMILPALDPSRPVVIGSLFAQGGFDWIIRDLLRDRDLPRATFFGLKRYPYLCRKQVYGREVILDGRFPIIAAAIDAPDEAGRAAAEAALELLFHKKIRRLESFLTCTLNMSNQILHMGLCEGHLPDYVHGERVYPRRPKLYSEANGRGALAMERLFRDLLKLTRALEGLVGLDLVQHLGMDPTVGHALRARLALGVDLARSPRLEALLVRVGLSILRSNRRLAHVDMPMIPAEGGGGFVPNPAARFWEDDVTHGLVVLYGLAQILDVEVPTIAGIAERFQGLTGKVFIEGGAPGPDLARSGAPQAYGITTPEALGPWLLEGARAPRA